MRTIAWCMLALSLVGCHSGPRWCMRDCDTSRPAQFDDQPLIESDPQPTVPSPPPVPKDGPNLTAPPQPAQKERTPYESSSRPRPLFGSRSTSQASRSKSSSRTTQTARRSQAPAATTKPAAQDDSVKQLMSDLEKTKREKAALETKLSEDSAKQAQQRLELEARLALLQEQMRQQSALQQVTYQPQQAPAMSQPMLGYAGPMITSGAPSPSMQMPFSPSTPMYAPQPQAVPAWNNSYASSPPKKPLMALESFVTPTHQPYAPQPQSQNIPAWNNSASTWNTATAAPQQQVEQWPYSPQRR